MKNKKIIITGIIIVLVIGVIIAIYVSSNLKASRTRFINSELTTIKINTMYVLNKEGVETNNIQNNVVIDDDSVVLVLYDGDNEWLLGIELDENANKIKRIYGSEAKKCEKIFKETFKDRLAADFIVQ